VTSPTQIIISLLLVLYVLSSASNGNSTIVVVVVINVFKLAGSFVVLLLSTSTILVHRIES